MTFTWADKLLVRIITNELCWLNSCACFDELKDMCTHSCLWIMIFWGMPWNSAFSKTTIVWLLLEVKVGAWDSMHPLLFSSYTSLIPCHGLASYSDLLLVSALEQKGLNSSSGLSGGCRRPNAASEESVKRRKECKTGGGAWGRVAQSQGESWVRS